jgi:hypothetical protein
LARVVLKEFDFPVETQVYAPNGRVVEQLQYNDLLELEPDARAERYLTYLNRALATDRAP